MKSGGLHVWKVFTREIMGWTSGFPEITKTWWADAFDMRFSTVRALTILHKPLLLYTIIQVMKRLYLISDA